MKRSDNDAIQKRMRVSDNLDSVVSESGLERRSVAYTPYGLAPNRESLTGFVGQMRSLVPEGYFLGNGYRFYNTILMRFNSPDELSPFEAGGLNAYAYCAGDPVNRTDPSGRMYYAGTGKIYNWVRPWESPLGSQSSMPRSRSRSRSPVHVVPRSPSPTNQNRPLTPAQLSREGVAASSRSPNRESKRTQLWVTKEIADRAIQKVQLSQASMFVGRDGESNRELVIKYIELRRLHKSWEARYLMRVSAPSTSDVAKLVEHGSKALANTAYEIRHRTDS